MFRKFQFHKVRLKGLRVRQSADEILFQFHKVRLKVRSALSIASTPKFQFHKVRLKVSYTIISGHGR